MKTPSKTLIACALSFAASAATAQSGQPSIGLDPMTESMASNPPSMACPAGNETGMVHVNARKGEFFVDFSQTPHRVRKADSAWVSMQDTGNPVVVAYNAACPPPVMMFSALGLAAGPNATGSGPTAAALGLSGGANQGIVVGTTFGPAGNIRAMSLTGTNFAANKYLGGDVGSVGATAPNPGDAGLSLNKLGGSMASSVGGGIAPDVLGRSMGSAIGGFLGQNGSLTGGSGQRLGTTVAEATTPPTASANGALVQNTANIPLTHRRTIQAAATMQATENATFSSGAVQRSPTAADPNAGDPVPLGSRVTPNDN